MADISLVQVSDSPVEIREYVLQKSAEGILG